MPSQFMMQDAVVLRTDWAHHQGGSHHPLLEWNGGGNEAAVMAGKVCPKKSSLAPRPHLQTRRHTARTVLHHQQSIGLNPAHQEHVTASAIKTCPRASASTHRPQAPSPDRGARRRRAVLCCCGRARLFACREAARSPCQRRRWRRHRMRRLARGRTRPRAARQRPTPTSTSHARSSSALSRRSWLWWPLPRTTRRSSR